MKVQSLAVALNKTVEELAVAAVQREQFPLTKSEFRDLILRPDEQAAARLISSRLEPNNRYYAIDVAFPGHRTIKFIASSVEEQLIFKDCTVAPSAPTELVERVSQWYDRRLAIGHIAAAFEVFMSQLIMRSPTPAHAYTCFTHITAVFARTAIMTRTMTEEAIRVTPRTIVSLPSVYKQLRESATQICILAELLDGTAGPRREVETYYLDLPDDRRHLRKTYQTNIMPLDKNDEVLEITPR